VIGTGAPRAISRNPDRLALLALLALAALVFAGLLRGRILFERDVSGLFWGLLESFRRCLALGSPPLWNPWMGFGQPLFANPSAQVLYPWTWLVLLIRPELYYSVYAIAHYLLALGGVYALARLYRLGAAAAFVAAAVWALSGPLLSYVSLWHHFAGVAWMPWVLLAAEHHARRPGARRAIAWAAVASLQVLAGSLDAVLMTVALEALVLAGHADWSRPLAGQNARLLGASALAALVTAGLTSPLWVPALEVVRGSVRETMNEGTRTFWSLRPVHFAQWLVPLFPDDLPLRDSVRQYLSDGREPFLDSLYLGLAALPLALSAFLGPRRRAALGLLLVLAATAAVALGRNGVAYPTIVAVFPQLRVFRYPPKVAIVGALAFALLAGLGFETWRERRPETARSWRLRVALPGLLAVVAALALLLVARERAPLWLEAPPSPSRVVSVLVPVLGALVLGTSSGLLALAGGRPSLTAALAAALAIGDLLQAHSGLNPTAPLAAFARTPTVVSFLRRDGASRVYASDYSVRAAAAAPVHLPEPVATAGLTRIWQHALLNQEYPVSLMRYGIFGSYEADQFSLEIPQRRSLWLLLIDAERRPADHLRLLQLGGVSHVLARVASGGSGLVAAATVDTPEAGEVLVFRVPDALPRVFVTSGVRVADGVAAYRTLLDPGFDPRSEIVLPEGEERRPRPGFRAEARLLEERPDRLRIAVDLDAPGHLVVLDGYAGGWRAQVDGAPAPVLRANAAFRAVPLDPGRHVVDLSYRPRSVAVGFAAGLVSLVAVLLILRVSRQPTDLGGAPEHRPEQQAAERDGFTPASGAGGLGGAPPWLLSQDKHHPPEQAP
jgi:hypothetical protein